MYCMCLCLFVWLFVCMCLRVFVCVCVCVCAWVRVSSVLLSLCSSVVVPVFQCLLFFASLFLLSCLR